jgi:hexulose-6-phosphate isomerase
MPHGNSDIEGQSMIVAPKRVVDRRSFVKGISTATVGITSASLLASETDVESRIKRAVKFHMIKEELSVLDKFKLLKDLNFDGTEIHVTSKVDPREVSQAIEKTDVAVHGFLNSDKPDLIHAIDTAKYYGGTSVLVVAGRVDKTNRYDQVYQEQRDRIRKALPHAEKQNIHLLIENVWNGFLLSPIEMARFIDELDSPFAGSYFDVGNVVRFGWPEHWIRILNKRIIKLDIKEYSREKQLNKGLRKGFEVEIGEGDCDWPEIRIALKDIGYTTGWATAEVPGGDRRRLAEIAERMDRVLTYC